MPSQKVRCGPHFHHVDWSSTGPALVDHGGRAESVLTALGAPSGCRRKVDAWEQSGIRLGEVHTWLAAGTTDPVCAGRLRTFGFTPEEAAAWRAAGFRSVTELYALRRAGVKVEVAGSLLARGVTASRIATCAGGGAPLTWSLAWHETGLSICNIERLRDLRQQPDSIGRDGRWWCPHCHRHLAPGRAGQHLEGQRCYQASGRALADGWAAVPDNWAPVWLAWSRNFRSRHYCYASNRVQFWLHSAWGGDVTLETVLAAITAWRRGHNCRWEVATEAVMGLKAAEVMALAGPHRQLSAPPVEVAA